MRPKLRHEIQTRQEHEDWQFDWDLAKFLGHIRTVEMPDECLLELPDEAWRTSQK